MLYLTSDAGFSVSLDVGVRNTLLFISNENGSHESFVGIITKKIINGSHFARLDKIGGEAITAPTITTNGTVITLSCPSDYYLLFFISATGIRKV